MKTQEIIFVFCLCTILSPLSSAQATIMGAVVDNGNGTFTYSYEVDNNLVGFDIFAWSLEFSITPDWVQLDTFSGGDVSIPNLDWFAQAGIPIIGIAAQDFISLDPSADVLIGETLSGFSFTSAFLPGSVTYFEFGALGESTSGMTLGPVSPPPVPPVIPEPGTVLLFGVCLVGLLIFYRLKRR